MNMGQSSSGHGPLSNSSHPSVIFSLHACTHRSAYLSPHVPVPAYISVNVTDHVEREQDLVIWRKIGVSRPLMARRCQQFGAHVKILKSSTLGCYLTFLFENDVSRREPFTDGLESTNCQAKSMFSGLEACNNSLVIFHDELVFVYRLWSKVTNRTITRGRVVLTVAIREKSKPWWVI